MNEKEEKEANKGREEVPYSILQNNESEGN